MATLQHSYSPLLLSPSSTTITNPNPHFDNSDQGSVDSDYTSLGSSRFYGHSGSTSSLHRQGRSQSIDELASTTTSTTTTSIPTRHFNGTFNINKSPADPLQFVKIHPNHDLIERAQEQLTLAETRKRLQETYKFTTHAQGNQINHEEGNDWSKVRDVYSDSVCCSISDRRGSSLRECEQIHHVMKSFVSCVLRWNGKQERCYLIFGQYTSSRFLSLLAINE